MANNTIRCTVLCVLLLSNLIGCTPSLIQQAERIPYHQAAYIEQIGQDVEILTLFRQRVESWGVTVGPLTLLDGSIVGRVDRRFLVIEIDMTASPTGQLVILAHEAAHLFHPPTLSRPQAEVFSVLVSHRALKYYGIDTTETTKFYLASVKHELHIAKSIEQDIIYAAEILTGQREFAGFRR